MSVIGKTEQGRDAVRVITDPLGEDLSFEQRGDAVVGQMNEEVLWTAGVTKHWNLNAEPFYIASDEEGDRDISISLLVLKEGGVHDNLIVSTDVTDGRTPVLLSGGNMLSIQSGVALKSIEGNIWVGRDGPSFNLGIPTNDPGDPIGGGEVEAHIASDKLMTRHPFFTVPHRVIYTQYQDKWRALVIKGQHYCTEKAEVAIYAYPILPGGGTPRWELDRQSFSGSSSPFEFSPPLGISRGESVFLAGSRFEVVGVSKMGANVIIQTRITVALVKDGSELQRSLSFP